MSRPSRYDPLICICLFLILYALQVETIAQSLPIVNPSFERGGPETPAGWTRFADEGEWLRGDAADSARSIAIVGDGQSTTYWRSSHLAFAPSTPYLLRFSARSLGARGGAPLSGPRFCNRDLGDIPEQWSEFRSVFFTPALIDTNRAWLRFGQWHVNGAGRAGCTGSLVVG
jgi:hypothetical protein